ncbi:unnamed protein product, partial [Porites lobata]
MVVRRAVFIQSLIVVVYVLFNKQAVCTRASSSNYSPNNTPTCEQKVRIPWKPGTPPYLTTRRCLNECGTCYTKHEKNFDQACKYQKKCCAFNFTK